MTPPWMRLLDPSYQLTLALDQLIPDQRNAQPRRRRLPNPAAVLSAQPVESPASPVPQVTQPNVNNNSNSSRPIPVPGTQDVYVTGDEVNTIDRCNLRRRMRVIHYRNGTGTDDFIQGIGDVLPRPGFRVCTVAVDAYSSNDFVFSAFRDLGLRILVGPERSTSLGARLEAHLGEGIVGYLRLMGGNLETDGASYLNGAPLSGDTTPSVSGGWGAVGVGLVHRSSDPDAGIMNGGADRIGFNLGFTNTSIDHPAGGGESRSHINWRLSFIRESDLLGFNIPSFWGIPRGRLALEVLPSILNINLNNDTESSCRGFACSWGDLFSRSPFVPFALRYDFFPSTPSSASDVWTPIGQRRRISTEEFVFSLLSRGGGEFINLLGRGANTHQFAGVQAHLGTGPAGIASSSQYTTAGAGQFLLSTMRGAARGGDAVIQADLLRNTYEVDPVRFYGLLGEEAGILLTYGILFAATQQEWTPQDFLNCASGRPGSEEVCRRNPYSNTLGGSARMNFYESIGYGALLASNSLGWLGDPRRGNFHFWGSTIGIGLAGLVTMFTARKMVGLGGNDVLSYSSLGDTAPFFSGMTGDYDPIASNFLGQVQWANIWTSIGAMGVSYSIAQVLAARRSQSAERAAILNTTPGAFVSPRSSQPALSQSNRRLFMPVLRTARLEVLPGRESLMPAGLLISLGGTL